MKANNAHQTIDHAFDEEFMSFLQACQHQQERNVDNLMIYLLNIESTRWDVLSLWNMRQNDLQVL